MVKPYLATVARSAAIDHLRRTRAVVSLDDEEGEGAAVAATAADEAPTAGEAFESQATSDDVRRAVSTLPEGPRQVLLMRVEGGLSFREIADELAVPLGTALTWMRSATLKLRKMLGDGK
jgi:RNA polymerase sigma-70 factor (ECF subfamily)